MTRRLNANGGKPARLDVSLRCGAPAIGKLTVARALLRIVPGRLVDNHAVIDVAPRVFDFGTPGIWALVQTAHSSVLDGAAVHSVALVVATYCCAKPDNRP